MAPGRATRLRHGIANHSVASVRALGDPYFVFAHEAKHGITLCWLTSLERPGWMITLVNTVGEGRPAALQVRASTPSVRAFSELPRQDLCDAKHTVGKIAAGQRGFVPRVTCHLSLQEAQVARSSPVYGAGSDFMQMPHVRTPDLGQESCCFFASPSTQGAGTAGPWAKAHTATAPPARRQIRHMSFPDG